LASATPTAAAPMKLMSPKLRSGIALLSSSRTSSGGVTATSDARPIASR
jgi:hypothetical protein